MTAPSQSKQKPARLLQIQADTTTDLIYIYINNIILYNII